MNNQLVTLLKSNLIGIWYGQGIEFFGFLPLQEEPNKKQSLPYLYEGCVFFLP